MAEPQLHIRRKSTPPEDMSPITERDLEVESRLTAVETTVREVKDAVAEVRAFVTAARPQLAIVSMIGSGIGAIIVAVVVWLVTGK